MLIKKLYFFICFSFACSGIIDYGDLLDEMHKLQKMSYDTFGSYNDCVELLGLALEQKVSGNICNLYSGLDSHFGEDSKDVVCDNVIGYYVVSIGNLNELYQKIRLEKNIDANIQISKQVLLDYMREFGEYHELPLNLMQKKFKKSSFKKYDCFKKEGYLTMISSIKFNKCSSKREIFKRVINASILKG